MSTPRMHFTATLLNSGKVLIVGGQIDTTAVRGRATDSVELFDPASRSFTKAASLGIARAGHTATLLPDGRVLVAGGYTDVGYRVLDTTEIYYPVTDSWKTGAGMSLGRAQPVAVLLKSGKVLMTGGGSGAVVGTGTQPAGTLAEVYDPVTDTWTAAGQMAFGRAVYPTATLLGDGRVLVAGGRALFNSSAEDTENAEIYNPSTSLWCQVQPYRRTGALQYQSATLLTNGLVLVTGGQQALSSVRYVDFFDPRSNTWVAGPNMVDARCGHPSLSLGSGVIVVIGGGCGWQDQTAGVEAFDPAANRWVPIASLSTPRGDVQAVALPDGSILAVGGMAPAGNPTAMAELFRAQP